MRAYIINIVGNNIARCGQFSIVDGALHNGVFKIAWDEQQLLDLSALLSWWRQSRSEQDPSRGEKPGKPESTVNYAIDPRLLDDTELDDIAMGRGGTD